MWKQRRVEPQWPEALLLLAGALNTGVPLEEAFWLMVQESPEPLRSFFRAELKQAPAQLSTEQKFDVVFAHPSLSLVRAAFHLAHRSGGKAAALLKRAALFYRQRQELELKKQTLTAEARMTAWVVGFSPFVFFFGLLWIAPEFISPFFTSSLGWGLLSLILFLDLAGFYFIFQILKIDV